MGRRSDHTREELHQMAIKFAKEIIIKEGIQELSTRKIARKMGYTVGTLYNLFKNLDELVIHVNGQTLDDLYDYIITTTGGNDIQAIVIAYFNFSKEYYQQWSLIFKYQMRPDAVIPDWYLLKSQKVFEPAINVLKNNMDLSNEELISSAQVIWAGIHGISILYHGGKLNTVKVKSVEDLIINFITNYIKGLTH